MVSFVMLFGVLEFFKMFKIFGISVDCLVFGQHHLAPILATFDL